MVQMENLDIRTITMGISLRDCAHPDLAIAAQKAYDKICRVAARLVAAGDEIEREYGIPIINKRDLGDPGRARRGSLRERRITSRSRARSTRAAAEVGVNFVGGFSALVHKGATRGDRRADRVAPRGALAPPSASAPRSTSARRARASTWTRSRAWARS